MTVPNGPGGAAGQYPPSAVTPPPPNYLVWAILAAIFGCLPLGIVSIVYAAQVNTKWAAGDLAGAQASSANAKKYAWWSFLVLIILLVLYIIFAVLARMAGSR